MLILCPQGPEDVPVTLENIFIEEADAAVADAHGIRRPLVDILSMKEIGLEALPR